MKKYIREMIEDLKKPKTMKDAAPTPKKNPVMSNDLSNQDLSTNPEERVRQLDYQAHQSERLQTNS